MAERDAVFECVLGGYAVDFGSFWWYGETVWLDDDVVLVDYVIAFITKEGGEGYETRGVGASEVSVGLGQAGGFGVEY